MIADGFTTVTPVLPTALTTSFCGWNTSLGPISGISGQGDHRINRVDAMAQLPGIQRPSPPAPGDADSNAEATGFSKNTGDFQPIKGI